MKKRIVTLLLLLIVLHIEPVVGHSCPTRGYPENPSHKCPVYGGGI
jgi:hypothetical protein